MFSPWSCEQLCLYFLPPSLHSSPLPAPIDTHDLLDNLRGRVQVDEPLVDPHLEPVPGLGTLTTGRLPGDVGEDLGGEPDGTLGSELLVLGSGDEVVADLFKVLYVSRGEGDADSVNLGRRGGCVNILVLGDVAHLVWSQR